MSLQFNLFAVAFHAEPCVSETLVFVKAPDTCPAHSSLLLMLKRGSLSEAQILTQCQKEGGGEGKALIPRVQADVSIRRPFLLNQSHSFLGTGSPTLEWLSRVSSAYCPSHHLPPENLSLKMAGIEPGSFGRPSTSPSLPPPGALQRPRV